MKKSTFSTKKRRFYLNFKEICVQKYLYTFVFWVPSGPTHLLLYKSILFTFVFLGPFGTHPTPYTSGTFVLAPPGPGQILPRPIPGPGQNGSSPAPAPAPAKSYPRSFTGSG